MSELHDIVYLLKNDYEDTEELKYSLRSVCKNWDYRKVVFVGGTCPAVQPDLYIPDNQEGATKWQRSMHSLQLALECEELTEDIWLFNDDFFIMERPEILGTELNYFGGTLEKRVADLRKRVGNSRYTRELEACRGELLSRGKDALNFALHMPMLVNRAKALQLFQKKPNLKMFRSYYGNFYAIPCVYSPDCKVYDLTSVPNSPLLSTTDEAFQKGQVGGFIKACFPEPCKYEQAVQPAVYQPEIYTEDGDIRY